MTDNIDSLLRCFHEYRWQFQEERMLPKLWYHIVFCMATHYRERMTCEEIATLLPHDIDDRAVFEELRELDHHHKSFVASTLDLKLGTRPQETSIQVRSDAVSQLQSSLGKIEQCDSPAFFPDYMEHDGRAKILNKLLFLQDRREFPFDLSKPTTVGDAFFVLETSQPFNLRFEFFREGKLDYEAFLLLEEYRNTGVLRRKAGRLHEILVSSRFSSSVLNVAEASEGLVLLTYAALYRFLNPWLNPPWIPRLDDWMTLVDLPGLADHRVVDLFRTRLITQ